MTSDRLTCCEAGSKKPVTANKAINPNSVISSLSVDSTALSITTAASATGTATVTWTATDTASATVSDSFTVQVLAQPTVSIAIDDVSLRKGGTHTVTFAEHFTGDSTLIYTATIANGSVATLAEDDTTLTVTTTGTGTATVTITATDLAGQSVSDELEVEVYSAPTVKHRFGSLKLANAYSYNVRNSKTFTFTNYFADGVGGRHLHRKLQ